jgi:hypothetical protein
VSVDTYSHKKKPEHSFIVYLMKRGQIHTEIVSRIPHLPYSSAEKAWEAGEQLIENIRNINLSERKSKLMRTLDDEEVKTVSDMAAATRE